jgi:hypothetical protein
MPRGKFNEWVEEGPRKPLLTEEDLVNRAPNIYQGPLRKKPEGLPFWAALLGLVLFVASVAYLVSWVLQ